jgi:starch phosphorylase
VFRDLNQLYPDRITHITNGVTFRRWLMQCNPALTALINEAIGPAWVGDATHLKELEKFADDSAFLERFMQAKRANKERLAATVARRLGVTLDPGAMFDVQIKRMHEYKRQLLNILEAIAYY